MSITLACVLVYVVDKCLSIAAATSSSLQDVVPVSVNPAYGGIVLQENSVYSTTSVAEYENIDRKTILSESLILSVCEDVVPVSVNPAYGGIVLQENSVYSTTSVAEYENIDRKTILSESLILSVCG